MANKQTVKDGLQSLKVKINWHFMNCCRGVGNSLDKNSKVASKSCTALINDAAELAFNIKTSPHLYVFEPSCDPAELETGQVVYTSTMEKYNIIDSRTGFPPRGNAKPHADHTGRVGEVIRIIFPQLEQLVPGKDENLILVKSTVVVKFDKSIPRNRKYRSNKTRDTPVR
jgi:hypothetical protein